MSKFITALKLLKTPHKMIKPLGDIGFFNWMSDKVYLKLVYWAETGKKLNLDNPKAFNEKLQWLKLYDRKPEYSMYVDKYAVRAYISNIIGKEYLIPLIGVYNNIEDINWEYLPNKFILKCTHGSGSNVICSDKSKLDINYAKSKLKRWMKKNWFYFGREWPYDNIKPRIICESYMEEENEYCRLTDYKFYCFNGIPKYCQVIRGRGENESIDFYDEEWNHMPFNGMRKLPQSKTQHDMPDKYQEMIYLAKKLSKDFIFIRVDFYYIKGKIYFGELTFYPTSGFGKFYSDEWNKIIGDMIQLPSVKIMKNIISTNNPMEED